MSESRQPNRCTTCSAEADLEHPIFGLCRGKKFDEAAQIAQSEIAAQPFDPTGHRHMAIVLELGGRLKEALAHRNQEVTLSPRSAMSYFSRALLQYRLGDFKAAIPDFTRTAELDHEQAIGPANYLYRADCLRHLGRYDEAIADCANVPEDFDFPGFLGQRDGNKHHLLAEISRIQAGR